MSKRKQTMAALDGALRMLASSDEFEADNAAQRGALEATRAEQVEEKARLERTRAAVVEAEVAHQGWREASARERVKTNAEIDALQKQLETLQAAVAEKRAEHDNIIAGIAALHQRLKV